MSHRSLIAGLLIILAACNSTDQQQCLSHADCEAAALGNQIPSNFVFCHPADNTCYAGCQTDADCKGPNFRSGLTCEPFEVAPGVLDTTRHCLFSGDGGVADGSPTDVGSDGPAPDGGGDLSTPDAGADTIVPDVGADGPLPDLGSDGGGADVGDDAGSDGPGADVGADGPAGD